MSADDDDRYAIELDDEFGKMAVIDVAAEAAAHERRFNGTLTTVNDAVAQLRVVEGDFHWHEHADTDEFFLVPERKHRAQGGRAPNSRPALHGDRDSGGGGRRSDR